MSAPAAIIAALTGRGPEDPPRVPVGLGTRSAPLTDGLAPLPLEGCATLEEIDRDDFVLTAGAATPLDAITTAAAELDLVLCPLIPRGTPGTLGGLYASGLESPVAPVEGRLRDAVLGIEGCTGSGAPLRSGGRVVKNVTGYDLTRFLCGSRGTLGVVTRLHWRLRTAPRDSFEVRTVVEPARLLDVLSTSRSLPDPTALRIELDAGRLTVRAFVEGGRPSARTRAERIADGLFAARVDANLVDLPDTALAAFLDASIPGQAPAHRDARIRTARAWVDALVTAAENPAARAVVFPWIGLGTLTGAEHSSPAARPLDPVSRAIRAAWDPHGNLWDGSSGERGASP